MVSVTFRFVPLERGDAEWCLEKDEIRGLLGRLQLPPEGFRPVCSLTHSLTQYSTVHPSSTQNLDFPLYFKISPFQLQQNPNCASKTAFGSSFSSSYFPPFSWRSGRCEKFGPARDLPNPLGLGAGSARPADSAAWATNPTKRAAASRTCPIQPTRTLNTSTARPPSLQHNTANSQIRRPTI